jgi:hypothetical protein
MVVLFTVMGRPEKRNGSWGGNKGMKEVGLDRSN